MSRPNIIFIQSDSMDGRVMGCAGHPAAHTPNMDAIAGAGALFATTYCNSPQCCPSRASMWSGRQIHSVGAWNNFKGIETDTPTFQTALDAGGYRTVILGRTDHLSGSHSLGNRLAIWTRSAGIVSSAKHPPSAVLEEGKSTRVRMQDWGRVDEAVAWLRANSRASEAPFFMHLGFTQPHPGDGFRTSPHYLDMIPEDRVTLPEKDREIHPAMAYMRATKNCVEEFPDAEIRRMRRHYFAMIAEVDAMVGELLRAVESMGLIENTYFIYTSDHGEMGMEHGQYLKNALYDPSARVPLVLRGPGVPSGSVVDAPVSLLDVFPTLMDMADLTPPDFLEGRSLLPLTRGGDAGRPDWVLSQYHANMQNTGSFMLRRGDWKYIAYAGFEPQLFNLREDPGEMRNLAASRPEVRKEMDARLRGILDYEAVDAHVKDYDRESFRRWRQEAGEETYRRTMTKLFRGWGEAQFEQIEEWLR